ncbi:MAG TPA: ABC transporter ATP-binding protein [Planctomycetaceae bacterium]|nr:ABC transporter ATP-binding protein [Planctomycetaceae bacterium]
MPDAPADLRVAQVGKSFPTPGGELRILEDIELSLARGEALAITGPSGAGKSTLLYIIGTLEAPSTGSVTILGQDPFSLDRSALARFRNVHLGFVFQDHYLLPQCSVLENVLIPTLAGCATGGAANDRARMLLERVGLAARIGHRPAELSGGERQRVAICRALINRPPLVLADEPTGNLDRHTAQLIGTLLLELSREENAMLIVVTHSAELSSRLPRHCELVDGKLK